MERLDPLFSRSTSLKLPESSSPTVSDLKNLQIKEIAINHLPQKEESKKNSLTTAKLTNGSSNLDPKLKALSLNVDLLTDVFKNTKQENKDELQEYLGAEKNLTNQLQNALIEKAAAKEEQKLTQATQAFMKELGEPSALLQHSKIYERNGNVVVVRSFLSASADEQKRAREEGRIAVAYKGYFFVQPESRLARSATLQVHDQESGQTLELQITILNKDQMKVFERAVGSYFLENFQPIMVKERKEEHKERQTVVNHNVKERISQREDAKKGEKTDSKNQSFMRENQIEEKRNEEANQLKNAKKKDQIALSKKQHIEIIELEKEELKGLERRQAK